MLSATSTDLASCPRCSGRVKLTLARFGRDVAGTPFRSFLAHHLKAYHREELEAVLRDVRPGLPSALDDRVDGWAARLAGEVEQRTVWTQDTSCSAVPCDPIPGACLTLFNPNPKSRECLCTDGVIQINCQGDKNEWVKNAFCNKYDGDDETYCKEEGFFRFHG